MAEAATLADVYRPQSILTIDNDFLRLPKATSQVEQDSILAQTLMAQQTSRFSQLFQLGCKNVLEIKIDRAELVKNYGFAKMDPYCRITVGEKVYETSTCYGASTTPIWNKVLRCPLPNDIRKFLVEIMDENQFVYDSQIAFGWVNLSDEILAASAPQTLSVQLSGKQGDEKEGTLFLQIRVENIESLSLSYHGQQAAINTLPNSETDDISTPDETSVLSTNTVSEADSVYTPTEDEVKQLREMFPTVEDEVIKSVLESVNGNVVDTVNSLLTLSTSTDNNDVPRPVYTSEPEQGPN